MGKHLYYTTRLEQTRRLQKKIVRIITFSKFKEHTGPLFKELFTLQTNRGHYKTEVTEILSEESPWTSLLQWKGYSYVNRIIIIGELT